MQPMTAIAFVVLLAFSALFSGSEAALFSLNRVQIRQFEDQQGRLPRAVRRLLASPQRLLNSLLVGNTMVNIALSATVTSYALARFGEQGVQIAILVASVAILIGGEIFPKTIALTFPQLIARFVAFPLILLIRLLHPLTWIVSAMARRVLRLLRQPEAKSGTERRITPYELRAVLAEIDEEAGMTKLENRLVQNILYFPRTTAEEVMTPRVDITAAPTTATSEEILDLIRRTKHARIPLYDQTLDEIVGYLPAKNFLLDPSVRLTKLLRPVLVVPEKAPVDRVFQDLRKGRWRMAVVVNEYGETVGLFTQEDLIEEIVGELADEYERVEEEIVRITDAVYEVRGQASVQDLSAAIDVDLPQEQAVTVNGLLCSLYGGFPKVGIRLLWEDVEFEILEAARHRIQKARVRKVGSGEEPS